MLAAVTMALLRYGFTLTASAIALMACASREQPTVAIPESKGEPSPPPPAATAQAGSEGEADPETAPEGEMSSWAGSSRGWLGVELEATAPDETGVRILRVVPKSPADRAGLRPGDVLVEIEGQAVNAPGDVVQAVSQRPSGTRVGIHARRGKDERLLAAELGAFPEGDALLRLNYVGQPAPTFVQLETAHCSAEPELAAHAGKVVVVEFWAPWCVACRALIPHMNDWHARLGARGLRVFGITNERTARAALFAEQLGMEFPVLADPTGQTTRAYGARAIPMVFVIDRRGMVRDIMVGFDARKLAKLDQLVERLIAER